MSKSTSTARAHRRFLHSAYSISLLLILLLVKFAVAQQSASDIIHHDDAEKTAQLESYLAAHPDASDRGAAMDELVSIYCREGKAEDRNRILEMKYRMAIDDPAFQEMKTPLAVKDFFNSLSFLVQLNVLDGHKELAAKYIKRARGDIEGHAKSKDLAGFIDLLEVTLRRPEVGDAMALSLESLAGKPIEWDELKGNVVLIHFWSLTCEPCIEEFGVLAMLHEKYRARGLRMIGISLDENPEDVVAYIGREGISWPQACDGKGFQSDAATRHGITSLPAVFVIGRDGRVAADETNSDKLDAVIQRELAE